MPSLKSMVLAILLMVITFFATSYYLGTLPQVQQTITERAQPLISFGQLVYAKWLTFPPILQQIILLGIPTLFAIFFMWTKDRAMQKLRQTEQQATIEKTQLSGEVNVATVQSQNLQNQLDATQKKLQMYEDFYEKSSLLDNKIASVQQDSDRKLLNMESTLRTDYSSLNKELQNLRMLIEKSKIDLS